MSWENDMKKLSVLQYMKKYEILWKLEVKNMVDNMRPSSCIKSNSQKERMEKQEWKKLKV